MSFTFLCHMIIEEQNSTCSDDGRWDVRGNGSGCEYGSGYGQGTGDGSGNGGGRGDGCGNGGGDGSGYGGGYGRGYGYGRGHGDGIGNYHWVKLKEEDGGKWIIAEASRKHEVHGKHYWKTFGHIGDDKTDFDFADIGEMVESREQQIRNQKRIENLEELNDTIFPLVDSLEAEGTDGAKWKAPAEYHKPLILEAAKSYIKKTWDELADPDLFFGE